MTIAKVEITRSADLAREHPDVLGLVALNAHEPGGDAAARPDLSPGELDLFKEWITERTRRFYEHGPALDGWAQRSDGRWQLWCAVTALPAPDGPEIALSGY